MSDENEEAGPETPTTIKADVTRDANFRRYSADQVISLFLGRDCEISFLTTSPTIASVEQPLGEDRPGRLGFEVMSVMTEVARVRITPETGITLAMSLISQLSDAGLINPDALTKGIASIVENCPVRSDIQSSDA